MQSYFDARRNGRTYLKPEHWSAEAYERLARDVLSPEPPVPFTGAHRHIPEADEQTMNARINELFMGAQRESK